MLKLRILYWRFESRGFVLVTYALPGVNVEQSGSLPPLAQSLTTAEDSSPVKNINPHL